ncbi:hypothetical protein CDD80_5464 [Ophiocordyceps camponoti-rufipedis]|uniref:Uncharacterized protein n=1 Tax=Ophiocordyceps camponoti-rufipedis TaxID=2004952 RepID=A0A2C5ZHB4_9HYPO|nr:hypothetical protein CDD80_5464 [Ophiocordyceps camponoti-rufipedis]
MGVTTRQRLTRLHELEMAHRENLQKTESIFRDEEVRLLKVQLLETRDDHAALQEDIDRKGVELAALAAKYKSLRVELEAERKECRARRAEVRSLKDAARHQGETPEDKNALACELDRLRPEMQHLPTQLAAYQAMEVERDDLRQQLNSLQAELDNERRLRQASEDALKSRLEPLEETQAVETKGREQATIQLNKDLDDARALAERLEERLSKLKTKYKAAQGELKETRCRLETCSADLERATKTAAVLPGVPTMRGRKHRVQDAAGTDQLTATMLHTPGNGDGKMAKRPVAGKKRGVELAALGEKSTFSITPFLRRTRDLADEEAVIEEEAEEDRSGEDGENGGGVAARDEGESSRPVLKKGLGAGQTNKMMAKPEAIQDTTALTMTTTTTTGPDKENAEAKKKKRKLAGSTTILFADDDDENKREAATMTNKMSMTKKKKKTAMVMMKKPQLVGSRLAAPAFSPLKRDRRGVNASFLA